MHPAFAPVAACALATSLALATPALFSPAAAGALADKAAEIEALIAAANFDAALTAARALTADVWDSSKGIGFTAALLIAEPSKGYGIYNPRSDENYKIGTPVILYVEPYGFAYGAPGDGLFAIGFFVDLKVMSEAGVLLADLPGLTEMNIVSRHPLREFQDSITYNLGGIKAGRYVLQTTLRDKNSGKYGVFENTIEIVE